MGKDTTAGGTSSSTSTSTANASTSTNLTIDLLGGAHASGVAGAAASGAPDGPLRLLKILVPTNFSRKSMMALEFALSYSHSQRMPSELYLFHSYRARFTNYRDLEKINDQCIDNMQRDVVEALAVLTKQGFQHSVKAVHRRLAQGDAAKEILRMAGNISADMMVMGHSDGRSMRTVAGQAPCTLVMVRPKDVSFVIAD